MRFTFITIAFSLFTFSLFADAPHTGELDDFLRGHATKVLEKTIVDRIPFFLDPRYRKKTVFWYDGSITTKDGVAYENLKLKFNTVSNNVYLKHKGYFYHISSSAISGFSIIENEVKRHFRKGYNQREIHAIQGTFKTDVRTIMQNILEYEKADDFRFVGIFIVSDDPGKTEVTIEFSTKSNRQVNEFNRFVMSLEGALQSNLATVLAEFDENTFLEILVIGSKGSFLKQNYKDISQGINMTLIKQSDTNTYNRNFYFLSNENQEIFELIFTKKSIKKALNSIGIKPQSSIPSVRNEKQLSAWLKKIL